MPPADNTPNFDAMTPEEIMAWMESLAKRQGADAGEFTTAADVVIAEIDPDSVVIDEPGYVPSEGKFKGQKITGTNATSKPHVPAPPPPPPVIEEEPELIEAFEVAQSIEAEVDTEPAEVAEDEPVLNASSLSWLESLAADQGVDFDLSSLGAELEPVTSEAIPAANPVDWLESLTLNQGEETEELAEFVAEPTASGDPMAWLESLAKRQGANEEELTTEANLDVPLPETWNEDGPGYTDYAFDAPGSLPSTPAATIPTPEPVTETESGEMEDPAGWLDSLASGQGFDSGLPTISELADEDEVQLTDDSIQAALARGEVVPHDQMEAWMSRQLEIGAQREEPEELTAYDPDAPAIPAELPDWLLDQVGQGPPPDEAPPPLPSQPALIDEILERPTVTDIPDWLQEEPEAGELDSIFAASLEEDAPIMPPPQEVFSQAPGETVSGVMQVDSTDPWVEAFDEEYERGQADISNIPEWYSQNVTDPQRMAAVERMADMEAVELQDANLEPETELVAGELEEVPDWLQEMVPQEADTLEPAEIPDWLSQEVTSPVAEVEVEAEPGDMPDWLKSIEVEPTEIPDWLVDTLGTATSEQPTVITPAASTPPPTPSLMPVPVVASGYSPAPVPVQAREIDVPETLNNARSRANANDIDASLQHYEVLIRANVELEAAVDDLAKLVEKFKKTPAVYRVLGDGLMRQGNLQAALDTYRKALNQL